MTYEPLHHKYRPQTFADLVGQDAIATTLTNAISTGRIVPAYLFTGPRGTGKTSSARILAKSLNCLSTDKPTDKPCGICNVCEGIAKGSTLDVIEIDAASNTGVDNIRELIERAQFAPVQCRYKVYVIDECHMLSVAAFNALLKTLEEPPERVVFVLATTDPQRVLPTIISRCQRFDFRRIPLDPMIEHLQFIAQTEQIPITPDAVKMVAQIAQGGLRDAESLLDQLSLLSGEIDVEQVWDLVGAVPERDLLELLKAITSEQSTNVIEFIRQLLNRGREPLIVLQNLAEFYRDLLIAKTTPQRSDLVKLTPSTWEELCQFAQYWEISTILAAQKYLRESETQIKNSTQPRLWLEIILLGLFPSVLNYSPTSVQPASKTPPPPKPLPVASVAPSPPPPVASPKSEPTPQPPLEPAIEPTPSVEHIIENHHAQPAVEPSIEPSPNWESDRSNDDENDENNSNNEKTPTPAPTSEEEYDLDEIWKMVLEQVQPPGTQELLRQHGHLLSMNTEIVCIGFKTQPLQNHAKKRISNIEAAFQEVFKHPVKVHIEVGTQKKHLSSRTKSPSENLQKTQPEPTINPTIDPEPNPLENSNTNSQSTQEPIPEFLAETPTVEPQPETQVSPQEDSQYFKIPSPSPKSFSPLETPELNTSEEERVAIASQRLAEAFSGKVIYLSEFKNTIQGQNVTETTEENLSTSETHLNVEEDPEDQEEEPDDSNVPF
ncbi:MAG: DNA polymerase III subunit gamma/tau [Cyanobacteriota bacterium]|nr:DNA polymerase III subunit gamma/tau [Cyanobacteriota bacterium]